MGGLARKIQNKTAPLESLLVGLESLRHSDVSETGNNREDFASMQAKIPYTQWSICPSNEVSIFRRKVTCRKGATQRFSHCTHSDEIDSAS